MESMVRETFVSRAIRVGCRIEWLQHRSGAATPQRAIASCDEWQAVFIARPVGVLRHLEFLFHGVPALAFLRLLLDLGRGLLHQRQDILGVLLGAEAVVGLALMGGYHPFPVFR